MNLSIFFSDKKQSNLLKVILLIRSALGPHPAVLGPYLHLTLSSGVTFDMLWGTFVVKDQTSADTCQEEY